MEKLVPDYRKGSVSIFETKPFQDWIKAKGYSWPPVSLDERDVMYNEFMRDGWPISINKAAPTIYCYGSDFDGGVDHG